MTSGRDTGDEDDATAGKRASAVGVGIVFLGLAVVTALLAGSFWVVATGDSDTGDPAKVDVAASRCGVSTAGEDTGIGTAMLSVTYSGAESVDLADATVRYSDEQTTAILDVTETAGPSSAGLEGDSGTYDPGIERGDTLTLTVPVERIRGEPLAATEQASIQLLLDDETIATTGVRGPNAMSASQSFVAC
jgi:hypothetical protein